MECSELEIIERPSTVQTLSSIHVCNEGDRVYYLEQDSLHLLYDFSLVKGDTYQVRYPIEFDTTYLATFPNESIYTTVAIDSVSIENIDGIEMKKQHISTMGNPSLKFGQYAIERLGYEHWILPFFSFDALESNIFDGMITFKDEEIVIENDSTGCGITNIKTIDNSDNSISIFPNPVYDEITIKSNDSEIRYLEIISVQGKTVFKRSYKDDKYVILNLNNFAKGSYIIIIHTGDKIIEEKIIVQ